MPTAANDDTTPDPKPRNLPPRATIDRLRAIAAASGDAMLADGPVHPDHKLLDGCGEALHLFKQARALNAARFAACPQGREWTDAERRQSNAMYREERDLDRQGAAICRRLKKLPAATPAGIYAKALIVRSSKTGAWELAMSLAADLTASPAVRASIWPADATAGEG